MTQSKPGLALTFERATVAHPAAKPGAPAALEALNISIAAGEQVVVIGPSGAGKTTFLHAAACALKPASGMLQLDGQDPWSLSARALRELRGQLFLAPQTPPLPPRQRVVTAVLAARLPAMTLAQSLLSLVRPQQAEAAHAALLRFDLGDKLWDRVDRLSGGERQRVGLARALLSPARLWLIDEPLSALDPARASQAMVSLTSAAKERGLTLVATLHQVDLAIAHFPRVIGLREGRLMFDLPSAEVTRERLANLYANHEHELTEPAAGASNDDGSAPQLKILRC